MSKQDLDIRHVARVAYYGIIEDIARQQKTLVEIDALRRLFGDKALPPAKLLRSHTNSLRDAPRTIADLERNSRERLESNYSLVRYFEEAFEQENAADMAAFADFIRERHGKSKTPSKPGGKR